MPSREPLPRFELRVTEPPEIDVVLGAHLGVLTKHGNVNVIGM